MMRRSPAKPFHNTKFAAVVVDFRGEKRVEEGGRRQPAGACLFTKGISPGNRLKDGKRKRRRRRKRLLSAKNATRKRGSRKKTRNPTSEQTAKNAQGVERNARVHQGFFYICVLWAYVVRFSRGPIPAGFVRGRRRSSGDPGRRGEVPRERPPVPAGRRGRQGCRACRPRAPGRNAAR